MQNVHSSIIAKKFTMAATVVRENPSSHQSDTHVPAKQYKWDIYWPNCIVLAVLHIAAVYGMFLKGESKPGSDIFAKAYGILATIGITAGAHRLWSHRSYKARPLAQTILIIFASCTYQNSIYTWCRDHRMHHRYTETDADPHNSKRGFFFSHVGWLMVRKHKDVKENKHTVDMSDLEANPIVMFQHKYYYPIVLFFTVFVSTFVPWYFWGESLKVSFFRITIYRYIAGVNLTWCINSVAHLFGNKPYDKNIGPVDAYFSKYSGLGEGFHNYHHTFPWDYKASEYGNDSRNITTFFIDCLAWLGLVHDRKSQSKEMVKKRMQRTGDGVTSGDQTIFHRHFSTNVDKVVRNLWNVVVITSIFYLV